MLLKRTLISVEPNFNNPSICITYAPFSYTPHITSSHNRYYGPVFISAKARIRRNITQATTAGSNTVLVGSST